MMPRHRSAGMCDMVGSSFAARDSAVRCGRSAAPGKSMMASICPRVHVAPVDPTATVVDGLSNQRRGRLARPPRRRPACRASARPMSPGSPSPACMPTGDALTTMSMSSRPADALADVALGKRRSHGSDQPRVASRIGLAMRIDRDARLGQARRRSRCRRRRRRTAAPAGRAGARPCARRRARSRRRRTCRRSTNRPPRGAAR